jgi:acyl-coenzyme A synthetase/AMP-(fatty) acid ligase
MLHIPHSTSQFLPQNISFELWQKQVKHLRDILLKQPEADWLLFEQDCYAFSVLLFALVAANKKIILPPSGQDKAIEQCMQHADIFIGNKSYSSVYQFDLDASIFSASFSGAEQALLKPLEFNQNTGLLFFTSGSSGTPKAVEKTFSQLITEVEILEQTFANQLTVTDKNTIIMATVSHQHIYGLLFKLLWPIWSGRQLYTNIFEYPEHLIHQAKKIPDNAICLISSPAYYHRLIKDNVLIAIKPQLQALFSSGGPLAAEAAAQIREELQLSPIEVYGSTETGGIGWRQKDALDDETWQTFPQIKCRYGVHSEQLEILSPYIDKAKWYLTDDRVALKSDQRFKLLGRADRIVKIEEKRCSLDEIQNYLCQHPWVDMAYTLTIGGNNQQRLCIAAVITLTLSGKQSLAKTPKFKFDRHLKAHLKQYVEALVVPRKFRYLEQLPINSQGKLNKAHMEALFD